MKVTWPNMGWRWINADIFKTKGSVLEATWHKRKKSELYWTFYEVRWYRQLQFVPIHTGFLLHMFDLIYMTCGEIAIVNSGCLYFYWFCCYSHSGAPRSQNNIVYHPTVGNKKGTINVFYLKVEFQSNERNSYVDILAI